MQRTGKTSKHVKTLSPFEKMYFFSLFGQVASINFKCKYPLTTNFNSRTLEILACVQRCIRMFIRAVGLTEEICKTTQMFISTGTVK